MRNLVGAGAIHSELGDPQKAADYFEHATRLSPPDGTWQAEAMLAETCLELGKSKEAAEHAKKALQSAPADALPDVQNLELRTRAQ